MLIDGTNVVGSRPDGWWRDRPAAFAALVEELSALSARGEEVVVVFDGTAPAELAEGAHGGVEVRWATRRGPDAADDRLIEVLDADRADLTFTVVTSDRALAARARTKGAPVTGASAFRRRILDGAHDRSGAWVDPARRSNRKRDDMAGDSGPESGFKGVVEGIKGKAKDVIGTVTDDEELEAEGEAQQAKADAQRDVAGKEAEAEKARAEVKSQEAQQKANQ